jgi:hypothetical protein
MQQRGVANTELATAADDDQQRGETVLLLDGTSSREMLE